MSELQTQANMCESCAWDREAEYYVPDEGNMCSGCYAAYEEEREKAHTCDECGFYADEIKDHLESVSDNVKMCHICIETVDIPNKNKEVIEKGWDKILYEQDPWALGYYEYQATRWETSPVREFTHLEKRPNNARLERYEREFRACLYSGDAATAEQVLKDIQQYVKDQLG